MKTIYTELRDRLLSEVPDLRQVSMESGQLYVSYSERTRPPLALPGVLLAFDIAQVKSITDYIQECTARITVTYVTDIYNAMDEEHSTTPYDQVADIYRALQGWGTVHFSPLKRLSAARDTSGGNMALFVYKTVYETEYIDETALSDEPKYPI